jgi:hypothetical protein
VTRAQLLTPWTLRTVGVGAGQAPGVWTAGWFGLCFRLSWENHTGPRPADDEVLASWGNQGGADLVCFLGPAPALISQREHFLQWMHRLQR